MVSLLELSSGPAVVTPSHEAAITVENHEPPVEGESDQLNGKAGPPSPNREWKEHDVEEPDENPSAWQAEREENSIPNPVKDEIKQHVNKKDQVPWEHSKEHNMQLHDKGDDLENNAKPDWSFWNRSLVKFLLVDWINTFDVVNCLSELVDVAGSALTNFGQWLTHVVELDTVGTVRNI